jgi:gliding motility-associated-like protein
MNGFIRKGIEYLFLLGWYLTPGLLHAQYNIPENRVLVFGNYAGLDFNSGSPVPIATSISGVPGSTPPPTSHVSGTASAAVSDRNGSLLFYTNGSHVWDRTHNLMPNGNPIHVYPANQIPVTQHTTQGALIVPAPGVADEYFVFSLVYPGTHAPPSANMYGHLYYSVVDMQRNGGLGDVDPLRRWMWMDSALADKMVAIPGDDCNVWVLVHRLEMNRFDAFEVTPGGVNRTPVVSQVGSANVLPSPNGGRNLYWVHGEMKISPDRRTLAIAAEGGQFIELFDFDPATGQVSNARMLDSGNAAYGICFSPDNSKLYTLQKGKGSNYWGLYQYDLTKSTLTAIQQSQTRITGTLMPPFTQLKLAPNGKIYFGNNGASFSYGSQLGVIAEPNLAGTACKFTGNAVALLPNTAMMSGLGNEVVRVTDTITSRSEVLMCDSFMVLQAPGGYSSYEWDDGTMGSTRHITSRGTFYVFYRDVCRTYVDSFIVDGSDVHFSLGPDTAICIDPVPITLHIPVPEANWRWSDGSTDSLLVVRESGTYWAEVSKEGCSASDTIVVTLTHILQDLGNDTILCADQTTRLELAAQTPQAATVLWSNGSTDKTLTVPNTGIYWVRVTEGPCVGTDTVAVTFRDVQQWLGEDTVLCRSTPVQLVLRANMPEGATALWSNGSTEALLPVRDTGTFWVTVSYPPCTGSDTISVTTEVCDCQVWMPSAFTPNGDGKNDILRPVVESGCPVSNYTLHVFNRWGQLVYSSPAGSSIAEGWDGLFKGAPAEVGTYMYHVILETGTRHNVHQLKGDVTLIR